MKHGGSFGMAESNQQLVPLKAETNYLIGQRLAQERGGKLPPHQFLDKHMRDPDTWKTFGIRGTLSGDLLVSTSNGEKFTIKGDLVDEQTRIIIPERYLLLFNKTRCGIVGRENVGIIVPIDPTLFETKEHSGMQFTVVHPAPSKMMAVFNLAGDGQLGRVDGMTRLPVQAPKDELDELKDREQTRLISGGLGGIRFLVHGAVDFHGVYGKTSPVIIFTGARHDSEFYISMVPNNGSKSE